MLSKLSNVRQPIKNSLMKVKAPIKKSLAKAVIPAAILLGGYAVAEGVYRGPAFIEREKAASEMKNNEETLSKDNNAFNKIDAMLNYLNASNKYNEANVRVNQAPLAAQAYNECSERINTYKELSEYDVNITPNLLLDYEAAKRKLSFERINYPIKHLIDILNTEKADEIKN